MSRTRALLGYLSLGAGCAVLAFALASGRFARAVTPLTSSAETAAAEHDVAAAFGGKRRLNVLVLGNHDDEGTSDTIILAHLDLERHTATLVSIPRDTWVAVDGHGHLKVNSVIGVGGAKLSANVVAKLTGAAVDATMVVQPQGAKQLVDAMGGLNVDVEKSMNYDDTNGDLHIHFKPSEQYLTGGQVLEYMRFRHDSEGDFGRMRRQQQVVREIAHEMTQPAHWAKLPRLVALARRDVETGLTDGQLRALVEAYHSVAQDDVRTLTLPSRVGWVGDASVVFVDERWAKFVGEILCSPKSPPQDVILVANATGLTELDKVIVGSLRRGGWNVQTFVDQPARFTSEIVGSSRTADRLERLFGIVNRRSGKATVIKLGIDLAPEES